MPPSCPSSAPSVTPGPAVSVTSGARLAHVPLPDLPLQSFPAAMGKLGLKQLSATSKLCELGPVTGLSGSYLRRERGTQMVAPAEPSTLCPGDSGFSGCSWGSAVPLSRQEQETRSGGVGLR